MNTEIKFCPQCKEIVNSLSTNLYHCPKCKIVWYLVIHGLSEALFNLKGKS